MEDIKVYEFFLKLNTYLNRQNHLTNKMIDQEIKVGKGILLARDLLPAEVFDGVFRPLMETLETRVKTMNEMRETGQEFTKQMQEFFDYYKGTLQ